MVLKKSEICCNYCLSEVSFLVKHTLIQRMFCLLKTEGDARVCDALNYKLFLIGEQSSFMLKVLSTSLN